MDLRATLTELLGNFSLPIMRGDTTVGEQNLPYAITGELADLLIDAGVTIPVRCKDCKRCFKHTTKRNKQNMWLCMRNEMEVCVRPDDFCSYGERRE